MASIEIIVCDGEGSIINHKTQKSYDLGFGINRISLIEGALEEFKREIFPKITYDILADAQSKEKVAVKKDVIKMQWLQFIPNKEKSWRIQSS
ncbi:MAG: hypothetical protein HQK72_13415 [Desulfamplus sp.]|nr:hypothetical protein [Desulfamplus sp.]